MYKKIHNMLLNDMLSLGIVKTIIISSDLYHQLSDDEIYHLSGMLECSSRMRWMVDSNKINHISFIYSQYPHRKNKNEETTSI